MEALSSIRYFLFLFSSRRSRVQAPPIKPCNDLPHVPQLTHLSLLTYVTLTPPSHSSPDSAAYPRRTVEIPRFHTPAIAMAPPSAAVASNRSCEARKEHHPPCPESLCRLPSPPQ